MAAALGVVTSTVYQLCAEGKLAHVRVSNAIRIEANAVADYLEIRRRASTRSNR